MLRDSGFPICVTKTEMKLAGKSRGLMTEMLAIAEDELSKASDAILQKKSTCLQGELVGNREEVPSRENLVLLLRKYGRAKMLSQGYEVHRNVVMLGYDNSTFLSNCLVEMYGHCGCIQEGKAVFHNASDLNIYSYNILLNALSLNGQIDDAVKVFQGMPCRDVISWNAIIGALSKSDRPDEALNVYFEMMSADDTQPNQITFVSVLNTCSNISWFECGQCIHASAVEFGFELDVMVGTSLINLYGKCSRVYSSKNIFDRTPNRDIVCWNAMIAAYSQNDYNHDAVTLISKTEHEGIHPNNISFVCVLDACSNLGLLQGGQKIHSVIHNSTVVQDIALGNTLLNMYGKCKKVCSAVKVFESMPSHDVVSWNAMITVLTQNAYNDIALKFFSKMQLKGFVPDSISFVCSINACASLTALGTGLEIHHMIVCNYNSNTSVENALINMYGKCNNIHDAKKVFQVMFSQDLVTWNAMVSALAQNEQYESALFVFQLMMVQGFVPDHITFTAVLDACANLTLSHMGEQTHAGLLHLGYEQDIFVSTALVNMYGKFGNLSKARYAFHKVQHTNLVALNSFMAVLVENGEAKEALELFHVLLRDGVVPDKVSYALAFDACAYLTSLDVGREIHNSMSEGYDQDIVVATTLINMYGKCGDLVQARNVFSKIQQWDLVICNAMINAFAQMGKTNEALSIFRHMLFHGINPDQITFVSILTACSHAGEIDKGRHLFVSMNHDYAIRQSDDHSVCMVDVLGRAGCLDEAEALIQLKCLEQSAIMWLTLLGGCGIHGDREKALSAAEKCMDCNSEATGPYVLMSNIHAVADG